MTNIKSLEQHLTIKLDTGVVEFTSENETHLFLKDGVFDIRVRKEIQQDRHKIEIKEANENGEYGFYGVVLSSL